MILEGVKVVELSTLWAVPGSALYLADQGADVVKAEPPSGDESRRIFTSRALDNESPSYFALNRNKRGICADIRTAEGLAIVHKLVSEGDVLIHNYRPAVAERLGVSYERLSKINRRLIYAELSGYGKEGPYADRGAYDLILQALSGVMHRRAADGTPIGAGIWAADCSMPMLLAYGIALGLYNRDRTGKGTRLEMEHPVGGHMVTTNTPLRFPKHPTKHRSRAPLQGEHTDEVLTALGYDEARLGKLREAGVIS